MAIGDITIYDVDAPGALLDGEIPFCTVTVKFNYPSEYNKVYVTVKEMDTGGAVFASKTVEKGSLGSWLPIPLTVNPGFMMPNYTWKWIIEIGWIDFWGTKYPTASHIHTVVLGSNEPPECPSGYYYDIITETCVPFDNPEPPEWDFPNMAMLAIMGIGATYYLFKGDRR